MGDGRYDNEAVDVERFDSAANAEYAAVWTNARWVTPRVAVGSHRGRTLMIVDDWHTLAPVPSDG